MKALTILGTRPEAVKLAPVLHALQRTDGVVSRLCVTGQHRQMLDPLLSFFHLQPDYDLAVMEERQTLAQVASAVLVRLEPVLASERPDWVLVQGDTTTAAAAALGAHYAGVRVGHVEAGLRTGDKWQPFPEEVNRRLVSVVADLHLAPTARARDHLLAEGAAPANIVVTGNPVIDALYWTLAQPPRPAPALEAALAGAEGARVILVTAHRRENHGAPLERICWALRDLAARYGERLRIVYPVHLNPAVREPVQRLLGGVSGIALTPPLDYPELVRLLQRADLVLTDSGGLQEEGPALGKPVLVLREVTERPEAVAAGAARLVGTGREAIVAAVVQLLEDDSVYAQMARAVSPYGDGHAAERIVQALLGGHPVGP
ncbi:MAG: non-hydrolyzing UDP-N-acetylglucosamine 2-epimerase [Anaerolineae bacterium]